MDMFSVSAKYLCYIKENQSCLRMSCEKNEVFFNINEIIEYQILHVNSFTIMNACKQTQTGLLFEFQTRF